MSVIKVSGQCHCGAIAYEAEVEHGTIAICHCHDCQRQSGSAYRANIPTSADAFRLIRGVPKRYIKTADSGAKRVHAFCAECGGPIYATALENPQFYSLRVGALDQRYQLGDPTRQIWTSRRQPWCTELNKIKAVKGQT